MVPSFYFSKNSIFEQVYIFRVKNLQITISALWRNFSVGRKVQLLRKISIFDQNFGSWKKLWNLTKIFIFFSLKGIRLRGYRGHDLARFVSRRTQMDVSRLRLCQEQIQRSIERWRNDEDQENTPQQVNQVWFWFYFLRISSTLSVLWPKSYFHRGF